MPLSLKKQRRLLNPGLPVLHKPRALPLHRAGSPLDGKMVIESVRLAEEGRAGPSRLSHVGITQAEHLIAYVILMRKKTLNRMKILESGRNPCDGSPEIHYFLKV